MGTLTTTVRLPADIDRDRETGGYRVVHMAHGIAVFGPVPISDMTALFAAWENYYGYCLMEIGVAAAMGATVCVTNEAGAAAWRDEVDRSAAERASGDTELAWLLSWDTGISSMTIVDVLGSSPRAKIQIANRLYRTKSSVGEPPTDPDDLGRCVRLLDRLPTFRERLDEVSAAHPQWSPLVAAWPELEALYREEESSGTAPRTYELMKKLRGEREG